MSLTQTLLITFKFHSNLEWNCIANLMLKSKHSTCMNSLVCLTTLTYTKLRSCTTMYMTWTEFWDCWIVLIQNGKITQTHGQVHIRVKKTHHQLFSRVLRTIACFWYSSYGYAGTLNNKTIFNLSYFQEFLLDGSFEERESVCLGWFHSKLQTRIQQNDCSCGWHLHELWPFC